MAEHALAAFEAGRYASGGLPRWTRDLAARLGRPEQALQAALTAMREQRNLADYLAVQTLAGERWPALREELLGVVCWNRSTYPMDEVDILLHEGRIEDAMAAVDAAPAYDLVERVVEAALPGHPEWVFRACRQQFDAIADAGRSRPTIKPSSGWSGRRPPCRPPGRRPHGGPTSRRRSNGTAGSTACGRSWSGSACRDMTGAPAWGKEVGWRLRKRLSGERSAQQQEPLRPCQDA